jgi:hypothetical protein
MENLLSLIDNLKNDLKQKQDQLNNVINSIKDEINDHYFKWNKNTGTFFRFAIMLVFGQYKNTYDNEVVRNIKLSIVTDWKTKEYQNYYQILKATSWKYGWAESYNSVGFVCYLKDLHCCFYENDYINLWRYHIKHNKYVESLETFINQCKSNEINLYDLFSDTLSHNDLLTIVNHKPTKVKDVVIYIKNS